MGYVVSCDNTLSEVMDAFSKSGKMKNFWHGGSWYHGSESLMAFPVVICNEGVTFRSNVASCLTLFLFEATHTTPHVQVVVTRARFQIPHDALCGILQR
jgi:hypothetical protein